MYSAFFVSKSFASKFREALNYLRRNYYVLVEECTHGYKLFKNTYARKRTPRYFLHACMPVQTQYLTV